MLVKYTVSDLTFILQQIVIAEAHAAGTALTALIPDAQLPWGLRAVDGSNNNLVPGREDFGSADQTFPRLLEPTFLTADPFDPDGPGPSLATTTSYQQTTGVVVDAEPRTISNLIVDQTTANPAAVTAGTNNAGSVTTGTNVFLPNVAPDAGISAPFNSWMTLFGQFFDHGLDLVSKGGSGIVYMPLQPDDPLYDPLSSTNFMVVTRATNQPGPDGILGTADDVHEHTNTTTPWIDQNQTYTSHPSHQVFLREYVLDGGKPVSTGQLLDGATGGLPTWADIKNQARTLLGIDLCDTDITNLPLLATDPYGHFIPGTNGFPQVVMADPDGAGPLTSFLVEGNPAAPISTASAVRTGHAFLDDIAHSAGPTGKTADTDADVGLANSDASSTTTSYDNELLDRHFITGDGRGNENIGLTAVHHIFHEEHNRLVQHTKDVILASGDPDFILEWLKPGANVAAIQDSDWNGDRLFQAAKFGTEMQYQHLVFEEFARRVQPAIDPFIFNNSPNIDPNIVAEFAHAVYRFGHSMLTETVARTNADGTPNDIGLIEAFLNPIDFDADGTMSADAAAGAIVRGMTRQAGNEIDEFVTNALRNNLVGLPLDLASINIARARDAGVPSLNAARQQFYDATSSTFLKPYESWYDFALNLKNTASLVNFVAAYGTHTVLTSATTLTDKRDAATALILGDPGAPADRLDFLTGTGAWAGVETGLNHVDLWIGGLAEKPMPFGGLLGSTFNFVFENQLERLQDGDRLYYLSRLQGENFLNELEANSFTALVMANTDLGGPNATHLPGSLFSFVNYILEMDLNRQLGPDPVGTDPILNAIHPVVLRQDLDNDGNADLLQYSGADHVVLGGTGEDDILIASEGDDTVWGDGGNDRIEGGAGIDFLRGGAGDDIITDSGDIDNIDGGDGNDVLSGGNGFDLLFGGADNDAILVGVDAAEVFGGTGDDFILGGNGADGLLGNAGNDWIEGGPGFDVLSGDNSQLFFNSAIIGHDVLFGNSGGDTDLDAESGDDIMGQDETVTRNEGMFGFDWAIHKGDPLAANSDLRIPIFTTVVADILRDRFDQVEGLSGWMFNDVLRGDDRGGLDGAAELNLTDHLLTQEGIDRITGLQDVVGTGVTAFSGGNIILGGDGSDLIEGRGADDIIDGDRWLNARLSIRDANDPDVEIRTIDSLNEIRAELLAGSINPGQLRIVREILTADGSDDIDTALYSGTMADYAITFLSPTTLRVVDTRGIDSTTVGDVVTNVEQLQFADGVFNTQPTSTPVTLTAATEDLLRTLTVAELVATTTLPGGGPLSVVGLTASSGTLLTNPDGTWTLVPAGNDDTDVTFTYSVANGMISVAASATLDLLPAADANSTNAGQTLNGTNAAQQMHGFGGNDMVFANGGDDVIFAGADNDEANGAAGNDLFVATVEAGGDGNDIYRGGTGVDTYDLARTSADATVNLQAGTASSAETGTDTLVSIENVIGSRGNDTLVGNGGANQMAGGFGNDTLDGGAGNDTLDGGFGDDTLDGGTGADVLTGDLGADTFVFRGFPITTGTTATTRDQITDFEQGIDRIDLSAIDANRVNGGDITDNAFTFVGLGPFPTTTTAAQLRYHFETDGLGADHTIVEGTTNTAAGIDFQIDLVGLVTLTQDDFVL